MDYGRHLYFCAYVCQPNLIIFVFENWRWKLRKQQSRKFGEREVRQGLPQHSTHNRQTTIKAHEIPKPSMWKPEKKVKETTTKTRTQIKLQETYHVIYGNMLNVKQQHVTGFGDRGERTYLNTTRVACKNDYQMRTLPPPLIQFAIH